MAINGISDEGGSLMVPFDILTPVMTSPVDGKTY